MTVNQALAQISERYKDKNIEDFPDVCALKFNLVEIKIFFGGDTEVEDEELVKTVIETGSSPQ